MKVYLMILVLLFVLTSCTMDGVKSDSSAQKTLVSISTQEFYDLTQTQEDAIILDVRTPQEYHEEHIADAIQIDFYDSDFQTQLNELDKEQTYLIYCRSGRRSAETLSLMRDLGFTSVYDLDLGINDWKAKELPTIIEKTILQ